MAEILSLSVVSLSAIFFVVDPFAVLPETVLPVSVSVPAELLLMPPAPDNALLSAIVLSISVSVFWL